MAIALFVLLLGYTLTSPLSLQDAQGVGFLPNTVGTGSISGGPPLSTMNVPIAWCALEGSPAASLPNNFIYPSVRPGIPAPTTTDLILRDRNGRATLDIWLNQAALEFSTAIPIRGGPDRHIIPILRDPLGDQRFGGHTMGDVFPPPYPSGAIDYFTVIINMCRDAWRSQHPEVGNNGITAVNIKRFAYFSTMLGVGGCRISMTTLTSGCVGGNTLMVIDNTFTLNGSPAFLQPLSDPLDIVFAASLGYALGQFAPTPPPPAPSPNGPSVLLSEDHWLCVIANTLLFVPAIAGCPGLPLEHRALPSRNLLTQPFHFGGTAPIDVQGVRAALRDTNGDGIADNTLLTTQQASSAYVPNGARVPGMRLDPPDTIIPGDMVQSYHRVKMDNNITIPDYLDLSEVIVSMNTTANSISFGQRLFGILPIFGPVPNDQSSNNMPLQYWTFIDTDNNQKTGAKGKMLKSSFEIPTEFDVSGSDLIIKAIVKPSNITASAWNVQNGSISKMLDKDIQPDIQRMLTFPISTNTTATINGTGFELGTATDDLVMVTLNNKDVGIQLNKPFTIQAITAATNYEPLKEAQQVEGQVTSPLIMDKFDNSLEENGTSLVLQTPVLNFSGGEEFEPYMDNLTKPWDVIANNDNSVVFR